MPGSDENRDKALLLLAHARADIESAFALLAPPSLSLPPGVDAVAECSHPKWRPTFGGHSYCPECGAER